jgi:hypothetical protein
MSTIGGRTCILKAIYIFCLAGTILLAGCGQVKEKANRTSNKAGQLVGESAGNFFTGVGAGIDKTITTYDIRLSEDLKNAGIATTIAKRTDGSASNNWQQTLSIYMRNSAPLKGALRICLFNDKDQEIGRATTPIDFAKDDARYVSFTLEKETPVGMTKYMQMDLKKTE